GHLTVHRDRREERRHRPRGDGLEDRRGAALLPDVARPFGGRGDGDDRLRLRRADHKGASTGVRSRDEPADPASDGRLRRLISTVARPDLLEPYRPLPFPTTTDEPWRFMNLKGFHPDASAYNGQVRCHTPAWPSTKR